MTPNARSNREKTQEPVGRIAYCVQRNKNPFKVIVCLVTLVAFLFNTLSYDLALLRPLGFVGQAWAARTPLELTGVGSNRAGGPGVVKELDVTTFTLPEYLGHIKDSYNSQLQTPTGPIGPLGRRPNSKLIIHIQDAHCNYAAQHKIADILEYLNREYRVDTVNLEGGAKDYDLSMFTRIPDKNIREKVADNFVKDGLVSGAEYFAINNPEKASLWGVEDTKLYLENLNVYRESLKYKDEVEKHLKALNHILSNLKRHIYSKELFELDLKYVAYKEGNLQFKEYLTFLIAKTRERAINIKSYTNIYLLYQSLEQEERIDFKKANIERDGLVDRLQKRLSKNALEELVLKTLEFKSEKISQRDFYSYILGKAKAFNIELESFPELQKYIIYVSIYAAIDKMKAIEEVDDLEDVVKEALYQNDEQRTLARLSKNLTLLKNIFGVTLTREDYKYYQANKTGFDIRNYISFIKTHAPRYNIQATLDGDIERIDGYRDNITKFYECSLKRDEAFLRNIKLGQVAVLITGGFHSENLASLFKKRNISYVSIMPNFKNGDGYECPYFRLLAGELTGIEKRLYSVLSVLPTTTIAIAPILSPEITEKVWGKEAEVLQVKAAVEAALEGRSIYDVERTEIKGNDVLFTMISGKPVRIGLARLRASTSWVGSLELGARSLESTLLTPDSKLPTQSRASTSGMPEGVVKAVSSFVEMGALKSNPFNPPFLIAHMPEVLAGAGLLWATYRALSWVRAIRGVNYLTGETRQKFQRKGYWARLRVAQALALTNKLAPCLMIGVAVFMNPLNIINARDYFIAFAAIIVVLNFAIGIKRIPEGLPVVEKLRRHSINFFSTAMLGLWLSAVILASSIGAGKAMPGYNARQARMLERVEAKIVEYIEGQDAEDNNIFKLNSPLHRLKTGGHDRSGLRRSIREGMEAGVSPDVIGPLSIMEGGYGYYGDFIDPVMRYESLQKGMGEYGKRLYRKLAAAADRAVIPDTASGEKRGRDILGASFGRWQKTIEYRSPEAGRRFLEAKAEADNVISSDPAKFHRFVFKDRWGDGLRNADTPRKAALALQGWNGLGMRYVTTKERDSLEGVLRSMGFRTDYPVLSQGAVASGVKEGMEDIGKKGVMRMPMRWTPALGAGILAMEQGLSENEEFSRIKKQEEDLYRLRHKGRAPSYEFYLQESAKLRASTSGRIGLEPTLQAPSSQFPTQIRASASGSIGHQIVSVMDKYNGKGREAPEGVATALDELIEGEAEASLGTLFSEFRQVFGENDISAAKGIVGGINDVIEGKGYLIAVTRDRIALCRILEKPVLYSSNIEGEERDLQVFEVYTTKDMNGVMLDKETSAAITGTVEAGNRIIIFKDSLDEQTEIYIDRITAAERKLTDRLEGLAVEESSPGDELILIGWPSGSEVLKERVSENIALDFIIGEMGRLTMPAPRQGEADMEEDIMKGDLAKLAIGPIPAYQISILLAYAKWRPDTPDGRSSRTVLNWLFEKMHKYFPEEGVAQLTGEDGDYDAQRERIRQWAANMRAEGIDNEAIHRVAKEIYRELNDDSDLLDRIRIKPASLDIKARLARLYMERGVMQAGYLNIGVAPCSYLLDAASLYGINPSQILMDVMRSMLPGPADSPEYQKNLDYFSELAAKMQEIALGLSVEEMEKTTIQDLNNRAASLLPRAAATEERIERGEEGKPRASASGTIDRKVLESGDIQIVVDSQLKDTITKGANNWGVDEDVAALVLQVLRAVNQNLFFDEAKKSCEKAAINIGVTPAQWDKAMQHISGVKAALNSLIAMKNLGDIDVNIFMDTPDGRKNLKKQLSGISQNRMVTFLWNTETDQPIKDAEFGYVISLKGEQKEASYTTPLSACFKAGLAALNILDLEGRGLSGTDKEEAARVFADAVAAVAAGNFDPEQIKKIVEDVVNNKLSNVLILVKMRPVNLEEIADRHKYEREVLRSL